MYIWRCVITIVVIVAPIEKIAISQYLSIDIESSQGEFGRFFYKHSITSLSLTPIFLCKKYQDPFLM
jgi:hypothetical protein